MAPRGVEEMLQSQQTALPRQVPSVIEAEALILRTRTRENPYQVDLEPHSYRAISAYASTAESDERAYVSALLGIDEYA